MANRSRVVFSSNLPTFAVVALLGMLCELSADEKPKRLFREIRSFQAPEAIQGVAVDEQDVYAVTNRAVGKYEKQTGKLVARWQAPKDSPLRHLNSGVMIKGKLDQWQEKHCHG